MKVIIIVLLVSVVFPCMAPPIPPITAQDLEVSLNSTLIQGRFAHPNQVVNFRCVTRGTNILTWSSTEFIGLDNEFQILSIGAAVDRTRGTTVATRVNTYDDNGVTVIVSQLRITASLQFPTSSVTCDGNGERGPSKTINFITTAQNISLNSTLTQGRYAAPNQVVIFICVTRNTTNLRWSSNDYIGTENVFQITSVGDVANQTRGTTVATRMDTYDDNGVTVIISQLRIIALLQFPTSSVTCHGNSDGPSETINFITTEIMTTSTVVTEETGSAMTRPRHSNGNATVDGPEQQKDSSSVIYVAASVVVGVVGVGLLVLFVVIITIVVVSIIKKRMNEPKKESIGTEKNIESCQPPPPKENSPPKGDSPSRSRSSTDESEASSKDAGEPR